MLCSRGDQFRFECDTRFVLSLRRSRFASLASGESQREVGLGGRHVFVFNGQTLFNSEETISSS